MKTKLGYAIVGMVVTLAAIGIPTLNIHTSSAMERILSRTKMTDKIDLKTGLGIPKIRTMTKGT